MDTADDRKQSFGAHVAVAVNYEGAQPGVELSLAANAGADIGEERFSEWRQAALYGVKFALGACIAFPCRVYVTQIDGRAQHTNSTEVAAAAANATWEAIEFAPPRELVDRIGLAVAERRRRETVAPYLFE